MPAAPLPRRAPKLLTGHLLDRFADLLRAILLAPIVALLALAATPAFAWDLDSLMAQLAQRKSGETRFTEQRTVSGLDAPLRASGRLTFHAPDRFARFTEKPRAESMEVQGNLVTLRRGSRSQQVTLDSIPELAALADAMRGTLNGDALAIRRHFRAEVKGGPKQWLLTLTPIDGRLAGTVSLLEIGGTNADVRSIDLRMAGGDRSLMLIEPLAPVAGADAGAAAEAGAAPANPAAPSPTR